MSPTTHQASVLLMFLPHFDGFHDLLVNRRTTKQNLSVIYTKQTKNIIMLTSKRLSFNRSLVRTSQNGRIIRHTCILLIFVHHTVHNYSNQLGIENHYTFQNMQRVEEDALFVSFTSRFKKAIFVLICCNFFFADRISQRCVQLRRSVLVLSVWNFGFKRNFYR